MDMFEEKGVKPMLLTQISEPLESGEWLNELKLDGIRCIAYLDKDRTELRNKRDIRLLPSFPELSWLHRAVTGKCVLDGEVIIADKSGQPDFESLQARSLTTDIGRIRLKAKQIPASFVAFDILYLNGNDLTAQPLIERKKILRETAREQDRLVVSRVIEGQSKALFRLTKEQGLEGIVQKRRDSLYRQGKRSSDWVKVKNLLDEDFLACGYIAKEHNVTSVVLGSVTNGKLVYQGHVTLGVSREATESFATTALCPFENIPSGNESAIWYRQPPVCTVTYMERTSAGGIRQPRFRRFRKD